MTNNTKNVIQRSPEENKTFSYTLNGVKLEFILRVDIKGQMTDFLKLLEAGSKELREEIEKRFPRQ
jgi:hypothetical protein